MDEIQPHWELTDQTFERWWLLLPDEDKAEFNDLYMGDEELARVVCALDFIVIQKIVVPPGSELLLALSLAKRQPAESIHPLVLKAVRDHPALNFLVNRIQERSFDHRMMRSKNLQITLLENELELFVEKSKHPEDLTHEDHQDIKALLDSATRMEQTRQLANAHTYRAQTRKQIERIKQSKPAESEISSRELDALIKANKNLLPPKLRKALEGE